MLKLLAVLMYAGLMQAHRAPPKQITDNQLEDMTVEASILHCVVENKEDIVWMYDGTKWGLAGCDSVRKIYKNAGGHILAQP